MLRGRDRKRISDDREVQRQRGKKRQGLRLETEKRIRDKRQVQ